MEYAPHDFSQAAINSGQRKINYALTLVDEKLANAIVALKEVIEKLPQGNKLDLGKVNAAIKDAVDTSRQVAGIKPPGCDPNWPA